MLDAVTAPILAHDAVGAVHPNMDRAMVLRREPEQDRERQREGRGLGLGR